MKTLNEILASHTLKHFLDKTSVLTTLTRIWSSAMGEWATHCKVANYEGGMLVLHVENSAWATKIRYNAPEILKKLLVFPEFSALKKINCIIILPRS